MYATQIRRIVVALILCFTVFSLSLCFHLTVSATNDETDETESFVSTESVISSETTDPVSSVPDDSSVDSGISDAPSDTSDIISGVDSTDSVPSDITSYPVDSTISSVDSGVSDPTVSSDIGLTSDVSDLVSSEVSQDMSSDEVSSEEQQYLPPIIANSEDHVPYDPIEKSDVESTVESQVTSAVNSEPTVAQKPVMKPGKGISRYLIPIMWISGILALGLIGALVYFNVVVYRYKKQHPELYPQKVKKSKQSKH